MTNLPPRDPTGPLGSQEPRLSSVPPHVSTLGVEAIQLAAHAGLKLDPWEQLVITGALGERENGRWSAYEVGLSVARQNGKGSVLECRELSGLFLFNERLIIHTAHEQKTATEHFRRVEELIAGTPDLARRTKKASRGRGSESIELRNGNRIFFQTRTGGGGRGLTGDLVVLDEAMIIYLATMGALVPTMAARSMIGNPQLWYTGSAVDQEVHEHGVVFASLRERGLAGADQVMWMEWSAAGDHPNDVGDAMRHDPEVWAQANPGMGIRISQEHIAGEANGSLSARQFAVERLGVGDWPDTSEEADRKIPREQWEACAEHDDSHRIESPIFALDVNVERSRVAVAVAGKRPDDLWQFAVVEHKYGTDWVVALCAELAGQHRRAEFVVDRRSGAAVFVPEMKAAGLRVVEVDTSEYADACAGFFDAVVNRVVRYPAPQPELDDAVKGVQKAPMGDAWKWSRRHSTNVDISPLVACTLALWGAQTRKPKKSRVVDLAAALQQSPSPS